MILAIGLGFAAFLLLCTAAFIYVGYRYHRAKERREDEQRLRRLGL